MDKKQETDVELTRALELDIVEAMTRWDNPQSDERHQFEEACARFRDEANKISEAAAATERLNAQDFAFRINATR